MVDPAEARQRAGAAAQLLASSSVRAGVLEDWRQRGGLRACFDGRQRLVSTFWLLGVAANLLLVLGMSLAAGSVPAEYERVAGIVTALATTCLRLCSWYCILRCRHNTEHQVFTVLALIATLIDIAFCVLRSPDVLYALYEVGAAQGPTVEEGT